MNHIDPTLKGSPVLSIGGRAIGRNEPPFVIAEMSGNHNGDIARAKAIIDMAADCGADAVKMQTYRADTITINHDSDEFMIRGGLWDGRKLYDLYQEAHTPWEWHDELFAHARARDILIFSSPFDHSAVDFLEGLKAPAYKIASFEIVDLPLIRKAAATGKPLIMSTGMSSLTDIEEAVAVARDTSHAGLVLLHCVSGYPSPVEDANLRAMVDLAKHFDIEVGLSDHSLGTSVAIAATALGAAVIEKHVTLDRSAGGPDDAFSLEPDELRALCSGVREAWSALGSPERHIRKSETAALNHRRSLYVVKPLKKGEVATAEHIRSIRPANGLPPKHWDKVIGMKAAQDIPFGTPLSFDLLED